MFAAIFTISIPAFAHNGHQYGHDKNKVHGHDALMVSMGASTSEGYTFDSSLLGLPFGHFYAENHHIPLLAEYLKTFFGVHDVILHNYAVAGKTSDEVLAEQLPQALAVIPNQNRDMVFTVEGGGNDLRHFLSSFMAECSSSDPMDQYVCLINLNATLDSIEGNLYEIVSQILAAAPEAEVIMQTQYNSFYGTLPNGQACADASTLMLADMALEGNPEYGHPLKGLNVRIREIAAELGVKVGDIAGYLYTSPGELYKNPAFFGGDCTHLSGVWDGIPAAGIPANELGLGYQAILGSFIYALNN